GYLVKNGYLLGRTNNGNGCWAPGTAI
ncbi:hypothetical protein ACN38_g4469, partial [Penicillium nordicum]